MTGGRYGGALAGGLSERDVRPRDGVGVDGYHRASNQSARG
jgi:hypothetical protein